MVIKTRLWSSKVRKWMGENSLPPSHLCAKIWFAGDFLVLILCALRFNQQSLTFYLFSLPPSPSSINLPPIHPATVPICLQNFSTILAHRVSLLGFCSSFSCHSVAIFALIAQTLLCCFVPLAIRLYLPLTPHCPLFSPWNLVAIFKVPESLLRRYVPMCCGGW